MSLHIAPRRAKAMAGVVACSGRLLAPESLQAEMQAKPPVLLMHGEPSWAYLYRKVIAGLVAKGDRAALDKLGRFAANYNVEADGSLKLIDDPQKSSFAVKRDGVVKPAGTSCVSACCTTACTRRWPTPASTS